MQNLREKYSTISAIILHKKSYGEKKLILKLYSKELGKITCFTNSSVISKRNPNGNLLPLNLCKFQIYKSSKSYTVTETQLITSFFEKNDTLEKSLFIQCITDIFEKSIPEEIASEELFELLLSTFESINTHKNLPLILENFKIQLLKILGTFPEIALCYLCQKKWNDTEQIHLDQAGHLFCTPCLPQNLTKSQTLSLQFNSIKLINFLYKTNHTNTPPNINLDQSSLNQLKQTLNLFLQNYIQKEILSEHYL